MSPSPPGAVSAIIPTYDRAELLARALSSVFAQTLPPDEVIVVDDGSSDGTEELVRRDFPEVLYLRQANRGVSAARNRGIDAAKNDWVALLDSDDEWLPEKLQRQIEALRARPEMSFCHTDEIWIRDGRRVNQGRRHRKRGGWILRDCLPLCAISPSSVLLHRSVFQVVGVFDEALPACEDYDLWLRVCWRYPTLLVDERLVVKYGGHGDQLSKQVPGLDRYRILALEKLLVEAELGPVDRVAALQQLLEKISIYLAGVEKRGRTEEAEDLMDRRARWSKSLASMRGTGA